MVVEVFSQQAEADQGVDRHVHGQAPSFCGLSDAAPRTPVPVTATAGPNTRAPREHSNDYEAYRGSNEPIEQSIDPLVSPGTSNVAARIADTAA